MAPNRRSAMKGMNHMRKNIKRSAVVGGTVAALLGTSVALAAWTNYGEGSGSVTAGQAQHLTVTVSNVSGLFPTGSKNVPFTVSNPNPYSVTLTKATLKNVTVDQAGCDTAVISGADVALSDVVATAGTSPSHDFPVTMSNAATDACQGAVFTVTLEVTGLSS
jgi:hypothetical protein